MQVDPPDWLIDMQGASLGHGNHFSIRIQLVDATRKGTADIVILLHEEGELPRSATMDLPQLVADKLFVTLGFSFPDDIGSLPMPTQEILPIDLTIHRREPHVLVSARFDLGGVWLETKKSGPPVIEISRLLLPLAEPTLRGDLP